MYLLLLKRKAEPEGTIRKWGKETFKKIGKRWIRIPKERTEEKQLDVVKKKAEQYFDYALTTYLGGDLSNFLSEKEDIFGFNDLFNRIKDGSGDEAHKLYKKVVDYFRSKPEQPQLKQAVLDYFGRSLILLRDYFSSKPKTRLVIKRTSKKGTVYYKKPKTKTDLPVLKPTQVKKVFQALGNWNVTQPLKSIHVERMLKTGTAQKISGKINPVKKWELPQSIKEIDLRYKGDTLGLIVKQVQKRKGKRDLVTARVRIELPYEVAKQYILSQVKKVRTRNNLLFRLEHSAGYRSFLEKLQGA